MQKILVTGGAGYIGSTISSAISDLGKTPIILDSLVAGQRAFVRDFPFYHSDIAEPDILKKIKNDHPTLDSMVHCAARIIIPESVANPHLYYIENVAKSMQLFKKAADVGIKKLFLVLLLLSMVMLKAI